MDPLDTESEALQAQVMGHEVVVLGPRVAIALSAAAAAETARRLAAAAAEAGAADPLNLDLLNLDLMDPEEDQASQARSREA